MNSYIMFLFFYVSKTECRVPQCRLGETWKLFHANILQLPCLRQRHFHSTVSSVLPHLACSLKYGIFPRILFKVPGISFGPQSVFWTMGSVHGGSTKHSFLGLLFSWSISHTDFLPKRSSSSHCVHGRRFGLSGGVQVDVHGSFGSASGQHAVLGFGVAQTFGLSFFFSSQTLLLQIFLPQPQSVPINLNLFCRWNIEREYMFCIRFLICNSILLKESNDFFFKYLKWKTQKNLEI